MYKWFVPHSEVIEDGNQPVVRVFHWRWRQTDCATVETPPPPLSESSHWRHSKTTQNNKLSTTKQHLLHILLCN